VAGLLPVDGSSSSLSLLLDQVVNGGSGARAARRCAGEVCSFTLALEVLAAMRLRVFSAPTDRRLVGLRVAVAEAQERHEEQERQERQNRVARDVHRRDLQPVTSRRYPRAR